MQRIWLVGLDPYEYDCGPALTVRGFDTLEAAIDYMARQPMSDAQEIFRGEWVEESQWWGQMRKKQMEIALAGVEKTHEQVEQHERAELARLLAKYGKDN